MQCVAATNRFVPMFCGIAQRHQESGEITRNFVSISRRFDSTHSDERNHIHLVENKQSAYLPLDTISDLCNAGFSGTIALACVPQEHQGRRCHHKRLAVQKQPALKSRIRHRKLAL